MKQSFFVLLATLCSGFVFSQQTAFYSDPFTKFKEAKDYFQKEQYGLAYPLLKELKQSVRETDKANNPVTVQAVLDSGQALNRYRLVDDPEWKPAAQGIVIPPYSAAVVLE